MDLKFNLFILCLAPEKTNPIRPQQKVIDGKAHAALFDPLKAVKNEADTTNAPADATGDPFADVGKSALYVF